MKKEQTRILETLASCTKSQARASKIALWHSTVDAPIFMPVGTQGTLKGMCSKQIAASSCHMMLGNTYHLGLRPGKALLEALGGLHKMASWHMPLLTDSGGFQMVSLSSLATVTESGVTFISPRDGSPMHLSPELSVELQESIGADIIMQLDDVVSPLTNRDRVEEAMHRSIRWLDRCIASQTKSEQQKLFAIIQGGLDLELRGKCIDEMVKRNCPGYAIGGLSGGEDKDSFWRVVQFCTSRLPRDRPIYCMGIGYAVDILVCVALGVDMFDCVYVTRTARFGHALVDSGSLSLKQKQFATDYAPIDKDCTCITCARYSRSFLHSALTQETGACHLISIHNISYQMRLMRQIRDHIRDGRFEEFAVEFLSKLYPSNDTPRWVVAALESVGIQIDAPRRATVGLINR